MSPHSRKKDDKCHHHHPSPSHAKLTQKKIDLNHNGPPQHDSRRYPITNQEHNHTLIHGAAEGIEGTELKRMNRDLQGLENPVR